MKARYGVILVTLLVSIVYSQVRGQDVISDRAPDVGISDLQTHSLTQTIQTVEDSQIQIGKQSIKTYSQEKQDYDIIQVLSRLNKKSYYKTINLLSLSRPHIEESRDSFQSNLILGLNKPYYKLKNEIRVIGNLDLRFENVLWGYPNSTTITVGYDLKKELPKGASDLRIRVDYIAFKVGIPFH